MLCRICWDSFVDNETPVVAYAYQLFQSATEKPEDNRSVAIIPLTFVSIYTSSVVVEHLNLKVRDLLYNRLSWTTWRARITNFDEWSHSSQLQASREIFPFAEKYETDRHLRTTNLT